MNKVFPTLALALLLLAGCSSEISSEEHDRIRDIVLGSQYWTFDTQQMEEMIPDTLETRDLRIASIATRNLRGVILEFHPDSTVTINIPARDQQTGQWVISERGDSMSLLTGVGAPVFQAITEIGPEKIVLADNPERGIMVAKVLYPHKREEQ
jgi:hypothetical protein